MSEDSPPKKSMREAVEEYKRQQRESEKRNAAPTGAGDANDDEEAETPDDTGLDPDSIDFERVELEVGEALARGPNVGRIVGGIFTFIGVLLLVVSAAITGFTLRSIASEVEAPGVVVRNELRRHDRTSDNSSSRGSSDLYHAVVEFKLTDGAPKTVEMSAGYWPKAWDEGQPVTVRYDPTRPLSARIADDGLMTYFASILTGFLGLVFAGLGIAVWRLLGRI